MQRPLLDGSPLGNTQLLLSDNLQCDSHSIQVELSEQVSFERGHRSQLSSLDPGGSSNDEDIPSSDDSIPSMGHRTSSVGSISFNQHKNDQRSSLLSRRMQTNQGTSLSELTTLKIQPGMKNEQHSSKKSKEEEKTLTHESNGSGYGSLDSASPPAFHKSVPSHGMGGHSHAWHRCERCRKKILPRKDDNDPRILRDEQPIHQHPSDSALKQKVLCDDCQSPVNIQRRCALALVSLASLPPELGWAVGEALIIPYLLSLGCPRWLSTFCWLPTPIFDSWLQPLYGRWTDSLTAKVQKEQDNHKPSKEDNSRMDEELISSPDLAEPPPESTKGSRFLSRLGGRKPFIILFAVISTIGMVLTPLASILQQRWMSILVAILGYFLMDMTHGHLIIPARALANDNARNSPELDFVSSSIVIAQAFGRLIGYGIVSLDWVKYVSKMAPNEESALSDHVSDPQFFWSFLLSLIPVWICILIVVCGTPSIPKSGQKNGKQKNAKEKSEDGLGLIHSPLSLDFVINGKRHGGMMNSSMNRRQRREDSGNESNDADDDRDENETHISNECDSAEEDDDDEDDDEEEQSDGVQSESNDYIRNTRGNGTTNESGFYTSYFSEGDEPDPNTEPVMEEDTETLHSDHIVNDNNNDDVEYLIQLNDGQNLNSNLMTSSVHPRYPTKHRRYQSRYRMRKKPVKFASQSRRRLMRYRSNRYSRKKGARNEKEPFVYPLLFKILWLTQFLGWSEICVLSLLFNAFTSTELYKGTANNEGGQSNDRFLKGIRFGTICMLVSALMNIIGTPILPRLNGMFGVTNVYIIGVLGLFIMPLSLFFLECNDQRALLRFSEDKNNINDDHHQSSDYKPQMTDLIWTVISMSVYGLFQSIFYTNYWIILENKLRWLNRTDQRGYCIGVSNLAIMYSTISISLFSGFISNCVGFLNTIVLWSIICGILSLLCFISLLLLIKKESRIEKQLESIRQSLSENRLKKQLRKREIQRHRKLACIQTRKKKKEKKQSLLLFKQ